MALKYEEKCFMEKSIGMFTALMCTNHQKCN